MDPRARRLFASPELQRTNSGQQQPANDQNKCRFNEQFGNIESRTGKAIVVVRPEWRSPERKDKGHVGRMYLPPGSKHAKQGPSRRQEEPWQQDGPVWLDMPHSLLPVQVRRRERQAESHESAVEIANPGAANRRT